MKESLKHLTNQEIIDYVKNANRYTKEEVDTAKEIIAEKELLSDEEVEVYLQAQEMESGQGDQGPVQIDEDKLQRYLEELRREENFMAAIFAGIISAIVSAILWAVITVSTGYQIGYVALAVGFIVGVTVRVVGKGMTKKFGILGALCALAGCVLGNILSVIGILAGQAEMGFFDVFSQVPISAFPSILIDTFSGMDLFFYAIALYEGYQFSFRGISEEEILEHAT